MQEPRNPFILGHRIERPYFCDRVEEQSVLTSAIINGRNVVLIAPRRMGKTSLIYLTLHSSDELKEDYISFFIDILQTNSLAEFTYLLGKTIFDRLAKKSTTLLGSFLAALKSLKGVFGFDPFTGTPTFNLQIGDIQNPEYTLEEIFRYLEESDRQAIVVIDEFQQVSKYPEKNTEALLRTHMQRLTHTSFIFAGSEQTLLQEMFVSSKRPFYNSAQLMHLGPIDEAVYVDFARRHFEERGRRIAGDDIRWVFSLFDGNTFYLQRTMNGAFADTTEGADCTHEIVVRAVKNMLASNEVIYREILSNVTVAQKAVLYSIAQERTVANPLGSQFIKKYALPSASSVQNALTKLMRQGLISKVNGIYSLTDSLLRIFINQLYFKSEV